MNEPTPGGNVCQVSSYRIYESNDDRSMLGVPVKLYDIKRFEKANTISVNIYGCINYKVVDDDECDDDILNDDAIHDEMLNEVTVHDETCRELLQEMEVSSDEEDETLSPLQPRKKSNSIHQLRISDNIQQRYDELGNVIENRLVNLLLNWNRWKPALFFHHQLQ